MTHGNLSFLSCDPDGTTASAIRTIKKVKAETGAFFRPGARHGTETHMSGLSLEHEELLSVESE